MEPVKDHLNFRNNPQVMKLFNAEKVLCYFKSLPKYSIARIKNLFDYSVFDG